MVVVLVVVVVGAEGRHTWHSLTRLR